MYLKLLATFTFTLQLSSNILAVSQFTRKESSDCNSGLYFTKEDFLFRKLTQPGENPCECNIKPKGKTVVWKCGKEKQTFNSKDIFGYTKEGETYLLKDKTSYKLEEKGAVFILSREVWVSLYIGGFYTKKYFYI